jgi:hypothetical protein
MDLKPHTKLGAWSMWLNAFFLTVIIISLMLVKVLGILSFDDRWWDVTVLVFLASIAAFVTGLLAIIKDKERSIIVYLSVTIGLLALLFLLLHSLFISD